MGRVHKKVLVIEPEESFFTFLQDTLEEHGYLVIHLSDALDSILKIEQHQPDIVIINQSLPQLVPQDVIAKIRQKFTNLPLLMIVDDLKRRQIMTSFKQGLDDFILKPFSAETFIIRVELLLLGLDQASNRSLHLADLNFNLDTLEVSRADQLISLTPREKNLLRFLMRNKNHVLSREVILSRVWDYPITVDSRAVDVYIGYLRQKVDAGYSKKLIHTVRGFGYMMAEK